MALSTTLKGEVVIRIGTYLTCDFGVSLTQQFYAPVLPASYAPLKRTVMASWQKRNYASQRRSSTSTIPESTLLCAATVLGRITTPKKTHLSPPQDLQGSEQDPAVLGLDSRVVKKYQPEYQSRTFLPGPAPPSVSILLILCGRPTAVYVYDVSFCSTTHRLWPTS